MKLRISVSAFFILLSVVVFAQQRITGRVTRGSSNEGVTGVTVSVKGGKGSTVTDTVGRYSISVPSANATLVFTSVGFAKREVPVAGKTTLDVILAEEASTLNDVVVIGYQ